MALLQRKSIVDNIGDILLVNPDYLYLINLV